MSEPEPPPAPPPGWSATGTPLPRFPDDQQTVVLDEEPAATGIWDRFPPVTPMDSALLILVWGALFLASRGLPPDADASLVPWGANVAPWRDGALGVWRLLASTALHATPLHLLSNTIAMALLGPGCARLFGRAGFWVLFAAGGLAASLASVWWRSQTSLLTSASVGASGAIFAIGGAILALAWRLRHDLPPGRARALGGAMMILLAQGLISGMTRQATDNAAHLGGLVAGILLGRVLPAREPEAPPASRVVRLAAAAGVAALGLSLGLAIVSGLASTR